MNKLMTSVKISNDDRVQALKFYKNRYMIVAHEHRLTLMNLADNFMTRSTHQVGIDSEDDQVIDITERSTSWGRGLIKSMAIHEGEKRLYVGGFDNKISVWKIA